MSDELRDAAEDAQQRAELAVEATRDPAQYRSTLTTAAEVELAGQVKLRNVLLDEAQESERALRAELTKAQGEGDALRTALTNLMALIDEGVLVRDISRDVESSWHMRMLGLVKVLAEARAALGEAT